MAKYSKKVREEAALICAIAASTPSLDTRFDLVAERLGMKTNPPCEALAFACRAWFDPDNSGAHSDRYAWAAATEQLIRTGWSPS